EWGRSAPGAGLGLPAPLGGFVPAYQADPDGVVVQTGSGSLWVLDPGTGRTVFERDAPDPWARPPVPAGGRTCLAPDNTRVAGIDTRKGVLTWETAVGGRSTLSGEPLQLAG